MKSLTSITLTRFKCFSHQEISLRPATVFTGLNGMGKSSVIQALLLLRQSARANLLQNPVSGGVSGLLLNGELNSLGTAGDVLHESAQDSDIGIALRSDKELHSWKFDANKEEADLLPILAAPARLPEIALFGDQFTYLGAERFGPRLLHALSDSQVHHGDLGANGNFTVAYLAEKSEHHVQESLRHPLVTNSKQLYAHTNAWMREVSPGVLAQAVKHSDMGVAKLTFGFSGSRQFRPTNVGFGLSYTLPVIVALLSASKGGLLLIENPEAHLHPRGQMAMGELIARSVSAGVQVLVETHSDHVLNGLRLAVKDGLVPADQIAIHFFRRTEREDGGNSRVEHIVDTPVLDADGRIDHWPDGFFDQYDIALGRLI